MTIDFGTGESDRAEALGRSLRRLRKELNLTMQSVADAAGLSVGFISQVERGLTAPSLTSLAGITRALGVPLGQFLDQPVSAQAARSRLPDTLTRHGQRDRFSIASGGVSFERLSTRFPGSKLTSVIVHEPPGERRELMSHPGEELIYVLSGGLTTTVEDETITLGPGDSIHFLSTRPHAAWNHTGDFTTVLWCGTINVFDGDGPDPIHRSPADL